MACLELIYNTSASLYTYLNPHLPQQLHIQPPSLRSAKSNTSRLPLLEYRPQSLFQLVGLYRIRALLAIVLLAIIKDQLHVGQEIVQAFIVVGL
jgi:hypothetical protein